MYNAEKGIAKSSRQEIDCTHAGKRSSSTDLTMIRLRTLEIWPLSSRFTAIGSPSGRRRASHGGRPSDGGFRDGRSKGRLTIIGLHIPIERSQRDPRERAGLVRPNAWPN